MNALPLTPGRIARSLAGRDQGRLFVVIREVDEDFVLIADGELRGVARPKKKRRKHLRATASIMELPAQREPQDFEIRSALCIEPVKEG